MCGKYFHNAEYVHPLKQKIVLDIVSWSLDNDDNCVNRLYVFGSSVTNYCHQFSDVDICIKWCEREYGEEGILKPFTLKFLKWLSHTYGSDVDVIHYSSTIGIPLHNEILEKGVVVYDKHVLQILVCL